MRNHAHVDVIERGKNLRRDARLLANVLADQTDDGVALLVVDVGELLQLGRNLGQSLGGVDRHRNADLGGGNHVDGAAVTIEDLEDLPQESVRHQHTCGGHIDDGDPFLGRNRLEGRAG